VTGLPRVHGYNELGSGGSLTWPDERSRGEMGYSPGSFSPMPCNSLGGQSVSKLGHYSPLSHPISSPSWVLLLSSLAFLSSSRGASSL